MTRESGERVIHHPRSDASDDNVLMTGILSPALHGMSGRSDSAIGARVR